MDIGGHVEGIDPVAEAEAIGGTICQLLLSDPQGWKAPQVAYPGGAEALRAAAEAAGIGLYVHAPYVINLASTNNRIRIPSRQLLQKTVTSAAAIGARGVVVHGGHMRDGEDPQIGFANWRKAVDGLDATIPVFIENTAGGQNAMARTLERIAQLWEAVGGSPNAGSIGLCLDTCHAHAAGLELPGLADRIRAITGRIDLVHLNDSRDAPGTGADRHANLGAGRCDPEALLAVAREAAAPLIVETPGGPQAQAADIAWLRARLS